MYDTICLEIRECELDEPVSFMEEVVCKIRVNERKSTNSKIVGNLSNMHIEIKGPVLKIWGSLSKWHNIHNVYGMEFKDVRKAIERLGKALGVPLEKAIVRRIDIAQTFDMKYLAKLYMEKLQYLKGYDRSFFRSTLYFSKESKRKMDWGNMQLCFYDKDDELKKLKKEVEINKYTIHERSVFLLRYELRLKNPRYTLGREIRCFDLFFGDFYSELIKLWYDMYNRIEKRLESLEDYCEMNLNGKKELYETCLRLCIMAFDMEKEVDIAAKKKKVTAQNKSNVLKKIKDIKDELKSKHPVMSMIDELNNAIADEYKKQMEDVKNSNGSLAK